MGRGSQEKKTAMASSDPLRILTVGEVRFHGWTGDQDKWFGEDWSIDGGVAVSEMEMGLRALVASFIRVEQHRGQKIQRRRRAGTGQGGKRRGPALASKARSRSRQPPPIDATHDRFALLRLLAGGNEEPGGRPGNECAPALGVPCSGHHHCCIKSGDCGM